MDDVIEGTNEGQRVRIGIGSRWKRNDVGDVAASFRGAAVKVLGPGDAPNTVSYAYEIDGSPRQRTTETFVQFFDPLLAGHDLSNPYLCQAPFVICTKCLALWIPETSPEPPECKAQTWAKPYQAQIDEAQGAYMRSVDGLAAATRGAIKQRERRYEPGRNGLGAGIIGRWPW